jgi:hypothetical protein
MSLHGYAESLECLAALDLAREFIRQFHGEGDPQEQERVCAIILGASAHVAESTAPGAWATFDPEGYLQRVRPADQAEAMLIRVVLVGFFGFLAFRDVLAPEVALRVVEELRRGAPGEPMLAELCRATTIVLSDTASAYC